MILITFGFFNSFGFIQRMKNGWHAYRDFIKLSKDVLNCVDRVSCFLPPSRSFKISPNKSFNHVLLDCFIRERISELKESLFLSKNPVKIINNINKYSKIKPIFQTILLYLQRRKKHFQQNASLQICAYDQILV